MLILYIFGQILPFPATRKTQRFSMGLRSDINKLLKENLIEEALIRLEKYARKKEKPLMEDYVAELHRRHVQHRNSFNEMKISDDAYNRQMNRLSAALLNAVRARKDDNNFMIQLCEFKLEGAKPQAAQQALGMENIQILNNILLDPNAEMLAVDQEKGVVRFRSSRYAFRRLVRAYDSGDLESKIRHKVNYIKTFDDKGQEREVYEFTTPVDLHQYDYEIIIILRPKVQASGKNQQLASALVGLGALVKGITTFKPASADASTAHEIISITFTRLPQQKHLIDKIMQVLRFDEVVVLGRVLKRG